MASRYFSLTCQALIRYRTLKSVVEDELLGGPHGPLSVDWMIQHWTWDQRVQSVYDEAISAVVLGAMCLEATLYDLAACLRGDGFARRIDGLTPTAKYSALKEYVDGEPPLSHDAALCAIRSLVKSRNSLVHAKSRRLEFTNRGLTKHTSQTEQDRQLLELGADASLHALVLLSLSFDGNIFEELRIIPSFKMPDYWMKQVPQELHADVLHCIRKMED